MNVWRRLTAVVICIRYIVMSFIVKKSEAMNAPLGGVTEIFETSDVDFAAS